MKKLSKKIAVVYCRISTGNEVIRELPLDNQEKICVKQIKKDNYKLIGVIKDKGKSGSNLDRPGIKEIINLAINKKIDALYTLSNDRLSINTYDYLYLRKILKENKVALKYIAGPSDNESTVAKTIDTMMVSFNEMNNLAALKMAEKKLKDSADA